MGSLKPIMFLLLGYGIVIWGGSFFVRMILKRLRKIKLKETGSDSLRVSGETGQENETKGSGRYTGYMERFMVFNAFYFRRQTGPILLVLVAFLLLAKLIILWNYRRNGETELSERYLAGTLSSFNFALVCAFLLALILPQAMHGH